MRNTDRIDRGSQIELERPAKQRIPTWSVGGRYLRERSITIHWRSIPSRSVAREKVVQNLSFTAGAGDAGGILLDVVILHALG
jgi:hypothetical protein